MANTTADKLALLASNKAAIKAAINAKSPATAPTEVMSQWPTAIASIPSGGGQLDVKAILDADPYEYANKAIVQFTNLSPTNWMSANAQAFRFSDNPTVLAYSYFHTWDKSKDINGLYRWAIFYSNNSLGSFGSNYNNWKAYDVKRIVLNGEMINTSSYGFRGYMAADAIEGGTFRSTGNQPFSFSIVRKISGKMILNGVQTFESVKGTVDLGELDIDVSAYAGSNSISTDWPLIKFFKKISVNKNYANTFACNSSQIIDPETLAKFDANDNIIGGICYGDNVTDLTGGTASTMTFHANVKTAMNEGGAGRWNKFVAAMTAKNWNISPAAD